MINLDTCLIVYSSECILNKDKQEGFIKGGLINRNQKCIE